MRKLHRSELKNWRATRPCRTVHVGRTYGGNCLQMVQQPLADEFAGLFELVSVGPVHLGEVEFTLQELQRAIRRLKVSKAPDAVGIAAELLEFIPDEFLQCLLDMCVQLTAFVQTAAQTAAWRNIWCLQACFWIRDGHLAKQFGLLAWICRKLSIVCVGPPYGQHWKNKAFLNI